MTGTGLLIGEIEKVYAERLQQYARFLTNLGLAPPYQWISGLVGVNGRHLRIPLPPGRMAIPTFKGPECLSENIIVEGTYDGKQTTTSALAPFFNRIFNKSGVRRETFDLLPL